MKTIKSLSLILSLFMVTCTVQKQMAQGVSNATPLPTGNYFIVSSMNTALTPLTMSAGQNVFLRPFNHGGTQQWQITRSARSGTYTIKMVGTDNLFFQPHDIKDRTAIIGGTSGGGVSFRIVPVPGQPDSWYIKSLKYNGDAMHTFVFSPELPTEVRFDPSDGGNKFLWHFVKVTD